MPIDELYPPVGYSPWWAVLGGGLILAAVALVIVVVRRTRDPGRPPRPVPSTPAGVDALGALRTEFTARVDELQHRFDAGELDERAVHLQLSALMRAFATRRTGRDASTWTLAEIERIGARELWDVIARNYPPSFADDGDPRARAVNPHESLGYARQVVNQW